MKEISEAYLNEVANAEGVECRARLEELAKAAAPDANLDDLRNQAIYNTAAEYMDFGSNANRLRTNM